MSTILVGLTTAFGFIGAVCGVLCGVTFSVETQRRHPRLARLASEKVKLFAATVFSLGFAAYTGFLTSQGPKPGNTASGNPVIIAESHAAQQSQSQDSPKSTARLEKSSKTSEKGTPKATETQVRAAGPNTSSSPSTVPDKAEKSPSADPAPTRSAPVSDGPRLNDVLQPVRHEHGTVKWFNGQKGYGFITGPNGEDVFVHFSAIEESGYKVLEEGERVEYTVVKGPKGFQAVRVRRAEPQTGQPGPKTPPEK